MGIATVAPLERALSRTKRALFSPFDIGKWFSIGFTVFLADIVNTHNGGGGGGDSPLQERTHTDWDQFRDIPGTVSDWCADNPVWFTVGLIVIIAIVLTLVWLSSRGKFMFLFNVANDESQIVKPWNEYGREANSLFLWRVVFGLICLIPVVLLIGFGINLIVEIAEGYHGVAEAIFGSLGLVCAGFAVFVAIAYIDLFLESFVVPIMYKERVGATDAWSRFLYLFGRHPWHFILYGLIVFVLRILVSVSPFAVALFTCCVGFLLLAIPYIGSVVWLPSADTYGAFRLEYREQFGPEYRIFK